MTTDSNTSEVAEDSCIIGCGSLKEIGNWCARCEGMLRNRLVGVMSMDQLSPEFTTKIETAIGAMHRFKTIKARMKRLTENLGDEVDINWARVDTYSEQIDPLVRIYDEAAAFEMASRLWSMYRTLSKKEQNRLLRRGLPLPGGHWLQIDSRSFSIDGDPIGLKIPYWTLLKSITANRAAWDTWKNVDFKRLFRALAAAAAPLSIIIEQHPVNRYHHALYRVSWWLRSILPIGKNPWIINERVGFGNRDRLVVFGHVDKLSEGERANAAWIERWSDISGGFSSFEQDHTEQLGALRIARGRLHIIVESGNSLEPLLVPGDPDLWAMLTSWSLSPPTSEQQAMLSAIRTGWGNREWSAERIRPADRRAAMLLWSTIDSLGDIDYDRESRSLIVTGDSGAFYGISSRHGTHGAPYRVISGRTIEGLRTTAQMPICLHDAPNQQKFPYPDRLLRVVLTVRDDIRASKHLEPLRKIVQGMVCNVNDVGALQYRARRRRQPWRIDLGRRADAVPQRHRWTALIPFIYESIHQAEVGDFFILPIENAGELRFGNDADTVRLETQDEIDLVAVLATANGWVRDGDVERFAAAVETAHATRGPQPDRLEPEQQEITDAGLAEAMEENAEAGLGDVVEENAEAGLGEEVEENAEVGLGEARGGAADNAGEELQEGVAEERSERWVRRDEIRINRATLYDILEPFQRRFGEGQAMPWWMIYEDAAEGRGPMHHLLPRALIQNIGLDWNVQNPPHIAREPEEERAGDAEVIRIERRNLRQQLQLLEIRRRALQQVE